MYHQMRWTAEKIQHRLKLVEQRVYRNAVNLPPFRLHLCPDTEPDRPLADPELYDSNWPILEAYNYWGSWRSNFTLRTTIRCPAKWTSDLPTALYLPLGESGDFSHPEALIYLDGHPYAGCDRHHQEILLTPTYLDGESHLLALYGWTGLGAEPLRLPNVRLFLRPCQLVQIDQPTRDFLTMARVALDTANLIDDQHPAKGFLLNALDEAFKLLELQEPSGESFYDSLPEAHEALKAGIDKAGSPLDVLVVGTGHAHIDVAWMWPLAQTRRKAGRTFATVLRLMEQFPEYHFTQSQPQLYEFVRQDYPEMFAAIQARVAEERWEIIGGMWVESDCNLTGPESLVRQFMLGRNFFRQYFGSEMESPVLWLPDAFGFSANLPQLIKQAGLEYFFTTKIGWNRYNRLPYDSFWWQGLDGTKVLTHFNTTPPPPDPDAHWVSTYNAQATVTDNLGTWRTFLQKEHQQELLMAFGYGDGGGGPTREMLENIREMAEFPAIPRMRQGPAGDFFRRLEKTSGEHLPTWNGELYLELHRGTYTSQSRNKRENRKSEFLLHDVEFLATLATVLDPTYHYPAERLTDAWKLVCLNQFHDILPGSSIHQVYVESLAQYEKIDDIGDQLTHEALEVIRRQCDANLAIINPTSFEHTGVALWSEPLTADQVVTTTEGKPVTIQPIQNGTLIDVAALSPFSLLPLYVTGGQANPVKENDNFVGLSPTFLENNYLYVEFNDAGDIIRIFDKTNRREVLPPGAVANQFVAFEDRPTHWDAWDVDISYDDKYWFSEPARTINVIESGPLRVTLEITRRILHSDYTQRISLYRNRPQIYFDTQINWQESNVFLKTAFPVAVLSPTATYEVQWGSVERPTHRNTSWDWARFEVCAQKWVDLSEGDYGVSLLNDCKYGHDIRDNVIRLSLLRAPKAPDPEADQGMHLFSYSLLPHAGRWGTPTIAAAYALNDPLIVTNMSRLAEQQPSSAMIRCQQPLIKTNRPNIVIETIKQAEDGNGLIVRFYESQRQRGEVSLTTSFPLAHAERVNLLEEKQADLTPEGNTVSLFVTPYQIVSLRLVPAREG